MSETLPLNRPSLRYPVPDRRRLEALSEDLQEDGYDRKRLATEVQSAKEQEKLVRAIQRRDPTVNGSVQGLAEDLPVYTKQGVRKEMLYKRNESELKAAPEAKAAKKPGIFGRAWETIKRHKVMTVVGLTALLGFLAYHYGIPWAQFSGAGGDSRTGGVGRTLDRLGRFAPGGDRPRVGELPAAPGGSYGSLRPPPEPIPGM